MNRSTNWERAAVKSVVVDLNARIIIDRFHIVQLVGRALGNARISLMKKMNDCHCREYKILMAQKNDSHTHFKSVHISLEVLMSTPKLKTNRVHGP